jgi:hypothetical protein
MRVEVTVTAVSWTPSESLGGSIQLGIDLRMAHYDAPPPDRIEGATSLRRLCDQDPFRFANLLGDGSTSTMGRSGGPLILGGLGCRHAQSCLNWQHRDLTEREGRPDTWPNRPLLASIFGSSGPARPRTSPEQHWGCVPVPARRRRWPAPTPEQLSSPTAPACSPALA